MSDSRYSYRPQGVLALEPSAWGMLLSPPSVPVVEVRGGAAVVAVRGPLMHHADPWCDSYDGVKARVLEALEGKPAAVVLSLDTPGGLVSGVFETAREIRAACKRAGVPLVAYVDGKALSAGYALACAADRIYVPLAGSVGSVGVVTELVDVTKLDAQMGIAFRYAYSGERKVDGNPHAGISDATLAAAQRQVDYLAGIFFEHVASARPGLSAEEVRGLQAGIVEGRRAVAVGLADEIATLDEVVERVTSEAAASVAEEETPIMADLKKTETPAAAPAPAGAPAAAAAVPAAAAGSKAEDKEYEAAVATLRKQAKAGNKAAQRMLRAELADENAADPDKDGDDDGAEGAADDEKDGEDMPDEKKKKDGEEASATALVARVDAIEAKQSAEAKAAEDRERSTLLASRPDLDEPTRKLLAAAPLADVRAWAATAPRRAVKPVAGAPAFTRPEGTGGGRVDQLPADEAHALDVQMGLATASSPPFVDGNRQVLPVMNRAAARAEIAKREAAARGGAAK